MIGPSLIGIKYYLFIPRASKPTSEKLVHVIAPIKKIIKKKYEKRIVENRSPLLLRPLLSIFGVNF